MATDELVGEPGRLDAVVARLTGASRADVQRALERGLVLVDGRARPKSFRLTGGERLVVDLDAERSVPPAVVIVRTCSTIIHTRSGASVARTWSTTRRCP